MPSSHSLKILEANELLFREGDVAENLYIVKKGMIRIFQPKGRGYIELAVVHQGELIGEMALFDENNRRRNASAEAIVKTELYEVSFDAFLNSYQKINPWFQTMLNTLVDRLVNQNKKVKSFESNSVSLNYKDMKAGGTYNFFKELEIIRLFSVFYMALKCQAIGDDESALIHESTLELFANDIFSFQEVKIREFTQILSELGLIERQEDEEGNMKILYAEDVEMFKKAIIFFNRERHQTEEKRLNITKNCIKLFEGIKMRHERKPFPTLNPTVNLQEILNEIKGDRKLSISAFDYVGAIKGHIFDEPYVNKANEATCNVDLERMLNLLPMLKLKNAFEKFNEDKRVK